MMEDFVCFFFKYVIGKRVRINICNQLRASLSGTAAAVTLTSTL